MQSNDTHFSKDALHILFGGQDASSNNTAVTGIPLLDVVLSLLRSYLSVNPSIFLSLIVPFAGLAAAFNYFSGSVLSTVKDYLVSTAEIKMDDEMYNYLLHWISQQDFTRKTRSFIAGTKTTSAYVDVMDDDDERDSKYDRNATLDIEDADESFDQYWEGLMNRDKIKPMYVTPAYGTSFFRYRDRLMWLTREPDEKQMASWIVQKEKVYVSCWGRNPAIIKELLKEAQELFVKRDGCNTIIYRASKYDLSCEWHRLMARPPRPLSTVILDDVQKTALVDDVKEYLHPRTQRWYASRGIPYRRGYILYGPPGTGKTSLSIALAGLFSLSIYIVDLNSKALTEEGLMNLFGTLPHRCIVLLEDIDSAGMFQKRSQDQPAGGVDATEDEQKSQRNKPPPGQGSYEVIDGAQVKNSDAGAGAVKDNRISLSGLLNAIDGVASSEGRILIMTTNHIELLDSALIRPGRVDMKIQFANADTAAAEAMFRFTYTDDIDRQAEPRAKIVRFSSTSKKSHLKPDSKLPPTPPPEPVKHSLHSGFDFKDSEISSMACAFASQIPTGEFSPAEVQGYLMKHKRDPKAAVAGVKEWMIEMREYREQQRGRNT